MRRKRAGVAEIIRTTCWGNKQHGEHGKCNMELGSGGQVARERLNCIKVDKETHNTERERQV